MKSSVAKIAYSDLEFQHSSNEDQLISMRSRISDSQNSSDVTTQGSGDFHHSEFILTFSFDTNVGSFEDSGEANVDIDGVSIEVSTETSDSFGLAIEPGQSVLFSGS